ncbi:MAG: hypothetical protein OEV54_04460, partial [Dehalococcoidia bacterium]|nr:hypothetical protein [Dehalococcoidia bacterium]
NLGIITESTLTISSTGGGTVIAPGEGSFDYSTGTIVRLTAKPDRGYRFVKWTGGVDAILSVNAARTSIAMRGDYSIAADFAINWPLIGGIIVVVVAAALWIVFVLRRRRRQTNPAQTSG